MCDDYDSDEPVRYTTVHARYHVIGTFAGGEPSGELAETAQTRAEAFAIAKRIVGPRKYDGAEVFDSMARRGAVNLWREHAGAMLPVERRTA